VNEMCTLGSRFRQGRQHAFDVNHAVFVDWLTLSNDARPRQVTRHRPAQRLPSRAVFEIVLGVITFIGVVFLILWLIGLPGKESEEELAGFVTANWDEVKGRIDNH
jgi:hypothetical protein